MKQWRRAQGEELAQSHAALGQTLNVNKLLLPEWRFGLTVASDSQRTVGLGGAFMQLKLTLEKARERVMTAIKNPYTTILGPPTGRLLLSREGYPLDHKKVREACAEHGVVIEINAHPRRLEMLERELTGLARADDERRAAVERAEDLLRQLDRGVRHRHRVGADLGLAAHALADLERLAEEAIQDRPDRKRGGHRAAKVGLKAQYRRNAAGGHNK